MKTRTPPRSVTTLVILFTGAMMSAAAQAAAAGDNAGPYVGAALGGSGFSTLNVASPKTAIDEAGRAFKLLGGYQLNQHFGLEAAYVRLGRLDDRFTVGGATVAQTVSGRSLYLAGTGRWPLTEAVAFTGKLGISFGKASGTQRLPAADALIGSQRSLVLGFGGEYRLNRDVALTIDYETYGKLSKRVGAGALLVGTRFSF